MPSGHRQKSKRRRRHHRSLRERLLAWLRRTLWPPSVSSGSSYPTSKERRQAFGFALALIAVFIVLVSMIILDGEAGSGQTESEPMSQ
jgi:hypothetical protein